MYITNSYVMLMLLILEMYFAKHTSGPLSPCSKALCGSHEGSEKGQAAEHPAEEVPERAAHMLLATFRHFRGT